MSTSVIEPGTRLAGRYRLEERISDSGGSSLWKAIDEILARAVAVRTFEPDFPRIAEVVTSARSASRLTDPRLTQVFDADDTGEKAYVVSEWVAGETLEQMLGKAPLEPGRAATLLYEAAEAIVTAHAAGLAHLCLTPRNLVWTTGGTVKVLGVATDAVLADCYAEDAAADDVVGLGAMLYAALTAHWPGPADLSSLPAAPEKDGIPQAPRQVQAGISHPLNAITCRALGLEVPGQEPIATPAELAQALRGVPRTPLPLFAGLASQPAPPPRPPRATAPPSGPRPAQQAPAPQPRRPASHRAQPQATQHHSAPPAPTAAHSHAGSRKPISRGLVGVGAAALTVILGLGVWAISNLGGDDPGNTDNAGIGDNKGKNAQNTSGRVGPLRISGAEGYDPAGDDSGKGAAKGLLAVDGKPSTVWRSSHYFSADFGKLKKGVGLMIDMGKPVTINEVKAQIPTSGASVQLKIGDSQSSLSRAASQMSSGAGETSLKPQKPVKGRYVLLWFTKLATGTDGKWRAEVSEINVHGSAS
ncbi:protein kinase family protein [Spirillospora sp. NPDC047279]|uniref:protein kinase family protein n=1 Tax=Spirillospora sp. NPDC047279 TaxID=3155478 RepID=UPI0033C2C476